MKLLSQNDDVILSGGKAGAKDPTTATLTTAVARTETHPPDYQ
jgi:hypothetical protein